MEIATYLTAYFNGKLSGYAVNPHRGVRAGFSFENRIVATQTGNDTSSSMLTNATERLILAQLAFKSHSQIHKSSKTSTCYPCLVRKRCLFNAVQRNLKYTIRSYTSLTQYN